MAKEDKVKFETVLTGELDLLSELRCGVSSDTGGTVYQRARKSNLTGLAFSGGGIRSATFNLGVIQALSRYGLLSKFDYLSTVSGGGYIGGWLSALLHRAAGKDGAVIVDEGRVAAVEPTLKTHPDESGFPKPETSGFLPVEHAAVHFLRRYSNYLTPRLGLSGDLLAAVSIFLRNFVLIQFSVLALVAGTLLTAYVVAMWSAQFKQGAPWLLGWLAWIGHLVNWEWEFAGGALLLILAFCFAGRLLAHLEAKRDTSSNASMVVFFKVVVPCTVAGWWLVAGCANWPKDLNLAVLLLKGMDVKSQHAAWIDALLWVLLTMLAYVIAWGISYIASRSGGRDDTCDSIESTSRCRWPTLGGIAVAVFAGATLGLLLFAGARYMRHAAALNPLNIWTTVGFGTPLFLLGVSLAVAVHIGVARRQFSEHDREWWARLGGLVLLTAGVWALIFALVIYAPPLVHWLASGGLAAFAVWATGSGTAAWIAKSPATSGATESKNWKDWVTTAGPWLFVGGLAVIVAYAVHIALRATCAQLYPAWADTRNFSDAVNLALSDLERLPLDMTVYVWLGSWAAFIVACSRLDINLFSMHTFYRNRLSRAYLGASRAIRRHPHPFTGFDSDDDVALHELSTQRPIPIINTSINMTGGDDLGWQTRRSASFTFTPCWVGFETKRSQGDDLGQYRPTAEYAGGLSLGTAVAISGAAASPNMGYHTSAAVSALLTVFNFRLGRWCGNPTNEDAWRKSSPGFAARPIWAELTGSATGDAKWINLSDGGHFENLGVYELIRRRCRLIVVTDAGCDPDHQFADLANLLRKCWTDFGVNIRFDDLEPMHRKKDSRYCSVHGAVGHIQYYDGEPDGTIIYLKSSLIGDEWPDIRQYADAHEDFSHETTADQFFDENQFEAYRHLGYKVIAKMIAPLQEQLGIPRAQ